MHFNSLYNDNQKEIGFKLRISENQTSKIESESFYWGKIKLTIEGKTVFWSSSSDDYWGNWILKNTINSKTLTLINPIKSFDIETIHASKNKDIELAWCKYFISEISSKNLLFSKGDWLIMPLERKESKNLWDYCSQSIADYRMSGVNALNEVFNQKNPQWCEFENNNIPITLKDKPYEESGRVKYWRKRAVEDKLPPILLLHISATNNAIILDGHDRLYASILENIPPKVIMIYEYITHKRATGLSPEQIERRGNAITEQFEKFKKIDVPQFNDLLIRTYENRPYFIERNTATLNNDSELWNKEVTDFINQNANLVNVENMKNRESL